MKTYTVTYHTSLNFGAVLQTYGLQKYLHNLHIDNEIVNIQSEATSEKWRVLFPVHTAKDLINDAFSFIKYRKIAEGMQRFLKFIENDIQKTAMYKDFEQLSLNPPKADAYICGSDQIWNISNSIRKEFFLQFGAPETKRISYAASFGVRSLSEVKIAKLKSLLKDFDSISIRENSGVDMLRNELQIEASQCIDPVFLIKDEWEKLSLRAAPIVPKETYILVYSLFNNTLMHDLIKKAKKEYGCKIVQVAYKGFSPIYHDKMIVNAGPLEFISLVKNAKAVITSSFHGTAFSVIFNKPFLTVVNPLVGSRITDLLESIGLEDRVAKTKDQYKMLNSTDFGESDKKVEIIVEQSKTFLKNALGVRDE